ncbi:unnamed protein product, partial [marine sediment metagenome]
MARAVRLEPAYLDRLPEELSGGEQQRIALAAAFAGNADLIVADESVVLRTTRAMPGMLTKPMVAAMFTLLGPRV